MFKVKIWQYTYFKLLAAANFNRNLSQRVVIQPQLLQIRELSYLRIKFDNIVET